MGVRVRDGGFGGFRNRMSFRGVFDEESLLTVLFTGILRFADSAQNDRLGVELELSPVSSLYPPLGYSRGAAQR